jgi:Putative transposase/Transposase zinc-binding domain
VGLELADIFCQYGPAYRQKFADQLPFSHRQAMRAIEQCRTEALGGQVYACPQCGEVQYSYHSCRNRHCPKCQNDTAQEWLEAQQDLLLPVRYFMLTFTLPAALNEIVRSNQRWVYNLLFRVSSAATQHLAKDARLIGGQIGMVGILHTWGRNLAYHPHIHYLVPAGGLATNTQTWLPGRQDFLLPVKALSKIFRGKFRQALQKTVLFTQIPTKVWQQEWVVHCKPVGNGRTALKYLAPYVFRVAISNRRLVKLENDQVTFRYRATDTDQLKQCTLSAEEFIHRFLQHVLPKGFVKVRYYGFFAPGCRRRLTALRQQLELTYSYCANEANATQEPVDSSPEPKLCCPSCGKPLLFQRMIQPTGRCPP